MWKFLGPVLEHEGNTEQRLKRIDLYSASNLRYQVIVSLIYHSPYSLAELGHFWNQFWNAKEKLEYSKRHLPNSVVNELSYVR